MTEKKLCFVRKDTVLSPHDLTFLLIKSKKHYKAKFSTNLILKKKTNKDNFGRKKKSMRKNIILKKKSTNIILKNKKIK